MKQQAVNKTPSQLMQEKYKTARYNLLLMLILTVVNIVLFFTGSETMFLFSASIPYYSICVGWMLGALSLLVIGAVVLIAFLICWLLSKKHYGWMIAALVLFVLDTLGTVYLYSGNLTEGIFDLLIHVWVLVYLVLGVINGYKLAHAPQEPIEAYPVEPTAEQPVYADPNVYAQPTAATPTAPASADPAPTEPTPADAPATLNGEEIE